jgi:hypothetical protein
MTTATADRTEFVQSIVEKVLASLPNDIGIMVADTNNTGVPTDEQLAKMNRFRPLDMPPYTTDEVTTVCLRASHNLLP